MVSRMHVKAMEMLKHAMNCACEKGYDCLTAQDWDTLKDCADAAEKAIKAEYYYHKVCDMEQGKEYRMTSEDYRTHSPEWHRDIDRQKGILYYSEPLKDGEKAETSKYDRAMCEHRKMTEKHNAGTPEDKQALMRSAEAVLNIVFDDIDCMLDGASQEVKNLAKSKIMSRMQRYS